MLRAEMLPAEMTVENTLSDKAATPTGTAGTAQDFLSAALRRLTMAAVAGAVAFSVMLGAPAPARADSTSDNVLKGLIALGAVGVLLNSIDKDNHRDRRPQYDNRRLPPAAWRDGRHDNGWHRGHSKFDRDRDDRRYDPREPARRNAWYDDRRDGGYDNRRDDRNDRRWPGPSHDR